MTEAQLHRAVAAFLALALPTEGGVLSKEQVACHRAIQCVGGLAYVCRSVAEVECALRACGIPLRATAFGKGVRRAA